jgi:PAS domain S-box-containing protein
LPQTLIVSEFNRELFDHIPHHVWFTSDANGNEFFFNSQWQEFTGLHKPSMTKSEVLKLVHPDDHALLWQAWRVAKSQATKLEITLRLQHKTAQWRWVRVMAKPIFRHEQVQTWIGTNTDVHEFQVLQEKAHKMQEKQMVLQKISLYASDVGSFEAVCEYFFNQSKAVFDYAAVKISQLVGPTLLRVITTHGFTSDRCAVGDIWEIKSGSPSGLMIQTQKPVFLGVEQLERTDQIYMEQNAFQSLLLLPVVTQHGVFAEIRFGFREKLELVASDVPLFLTMTEILARAIERIQLIQDLKNLNANLEEQVINRTNQLNEHLKELEQFVFSASHDFRAPLSVLLAASRRIREQAAVNTPLQRVADSVQNSASRMNEMLNTMLDLARGQQHQKVGQLEIATMLTEVLHNLEPLSAQKAVQIHQDLPQAYLCCMESDFYQILQNLLQNAIKFSDDSDGQPWIQVTSQAHPAGTWLEVVNNTRPMKPEVFARLFDLFYTSDPQGGMGVGLNIVKHMVERNGGRIWLEADAEFRVLMFFPDYQGTTEAHALVPRTSP